MAFVFILAGVATALTSCGNDSPATPRGRTTTSQGRTTTSQGGTTTSPPQAAAPRGEMAAPPGYTRQQIIFDDTFSGSSLNTSNWTPELAPGSRWDTEHLGAPYSSGGSNQAAYWAPSQVTVDNGLTLTARQTTQSDIGYSRGLNWVSGVVTSTLTLPSTGWYVQISAKMPDTSLGMWPALWFLPSSSFQEFDGFEGGWQGPSPNEQGHSDFFSGNGQQGEIWPTPSGADIAAGYNTYGFQYIPGQSVTVYFNGQEVYQVLASNGSTISAQAYYLLIELQVATAQVSHHTVATSTTPSASMKVAEVQAYTIR
jgi:hypothetical protein